MAWVAAIVLDALWRSALAVVPLAVAVWFLCRIFKCTSTTRHALWTLTLVWLVLPVLLPDSPLSRLDEGSVVSKAVSANRGDAIIEIVADSSRAALAGAPPAYAEPTRIASSEGRRPKRIATRLPARLFLPRDDLKVGVNPSDPVDQSSPPRLDSMMAAPGFRFDPVDRLVPPAESTGLPAPRSPAAPGCAPAAADCAPAVAPAPNRSTAAPGGGYALAPSATLAPSAIKPPASAPEPSARRKATHSLDEKPERPSAVAPQNAGRLLRRTTMPASDRSREAGLIAALRKSYEDHLADWVAAVGGLLAGAASLPRFPSEVWLTGAVLVLMLNLARLASSWGALRGAAPAPDHVGKLVRSVADRIGLSRIPKTWMTDARIGPMIRCGRPATLVLPRLLWSQLDRDGRRAVVCHELAHLKRCDHWVRRFEMLISVLYWWHPVVWWVRRQLHQEAELCCDAWVTWIMPSQRRSYAEALLQTKQYVGTANQTRHVGAIGILSGRASQLARRITMVMTGNDQPRLSLRGVALMAALAAAGWMATPARSCPPEQAKHAAHSTHAEHAATACSHSCGAKCVGKCTHEQCSRCANTAPAAATSFERYEAQRAAEALAYNEVGDQPPAGYGYVVATGDTGHDPAALYSGGSGRAQTVPSSGRNRSDDLKQRMERLEQMLEELLMRTDGKRKSAKKAPKRKRAPRRPRAPRPPVLPTPPIAPVPPVPPVPPTVPRASVTVDPQVTRDYKLPEGKLDALTELMVRSDVPILVRPEAGRITVIATAANHRIFAAFVDLINGSDEERQTDYRLRKGKLKALTALMSRSDVPVLVSPRAGSIVLHGNSLQQGAFAAFVEMIDPPSKQKRRSAVGTGADHSESELHRLLAPLPDAPEPRGGGVGTLRSERQIERELDRERRTKDRAQRRQNRQNRQRGERRSRTDRQTGSGRAIGASETARLRELYADAKLAIGANEDAVAEFNALIERGNASRLKARVDALGLNARVLADQAAAIELRVGATREQAARMRDAAIRMRDDAQRLDSEAVQLRQKAIELGQTSQTPSGETSSGGPGDTATDLYAEAELADVEAQAPNQQADALDDDALVARKKAEAIAAFVEQLVGYLSTLGS